MKNMEGKKYWIVEGKKFDTHWTTQTDRISFKSDDLWRFMEEYHQAKLKLLGIGGVSNCNAIFEKTSKFFDEDIECDATEADIY